MEKVKSSILETVKDVCQNKKLDKLHFDVFEEIFSHITKHEKEVNEQRPLSIRRIIERNME